MTEVRPCRPCRPLGGLGTLGAMGASREFYAFGLCTAVRGIPRLALFI